MTHNTRKFPTAVIASLTTGTLLCNFSDMHEAAEFLMGHPIWTHHFAPKDLCNAIKQECLKQHANLPTILEGVTKENYKEKVKEIEAQFGPYLQITEGNEETATSPFTGF